MLTACSMYVDCMLTSDAHNTLHLRCTMLQSQKIVLRKSVQKWNQQTGHMMTAWWLYDDCMMTVWWLYDDCMLTVCWLYVTRPIHRSCVCYIYIYISYYSYYLLLFVFIYIICSQHTFNIHPTYIQHTFNIHSTYIQHVAKSHESLGLVYDLLMCGAPIKRIFLYVNNF